MREGQLDRVEADLECAVLFDGGYREVGRGQLAGTEVVYFEKTLA